MGDGQSGVNRRTRQTRQTQQEHQGARVASSAVITTAIGVMSNIAATAGGPFWARHGGLAWVLLGLLVIALVVYQYWDLAATRPRSRHRRRVQWNARWLGTAAVVGLMVSVQTLFSPHDVVSPAHAPQPLQLTCGVDPAAVIEYRRSLYVDGQEVGVVEIFNSPRCHAVWGLYTSESPLGISAASATISLSRAGSDPDQTASSMMLTDRLSGPWHTFWSSALAYEPDSCYQTTVTLVSLNGSTASAATSCERF